MEPKKHSTSEAGHIKNLENFKNLIAVCQRHEPLYNPSIPGITVTGMNILDENATQKHQRVLNIFGALTVNINRRQDLFAKMLPLSSRVIQGLSVVTNDKKIVADARTIVNKIHGKPSKPRTDDNQPGQEVKQARSNSQRSYDKMREHLFALIQLLSNVSKYNPNEPDLNVEGLQAYYDELKSADDAVLAATVQYGQALTERDRVFYDEKDGLITTARLAKTYVKSVFGLKSLEYAEVKRLEFRTIRRIK